MIDSQKTNHPNAFVVFCRQLVRLPSQNDIQSLASSSSSCCSLLHWATFKRRANSMNRNAFQFQSNNRLTNCTLRWRGDKIRRYRGPIVDTALPPGWWFFCTYTDLYSLSASAEGSSTLLLSLLLVAAAATTFSSPAAGEIWIAVSKSDSV